MRAPLVPALAILATAALLAGCGGDGAMAPQPAPRPLDPLLAITVNGPLMSDQQLSYQSNADAVRPPDIPLNAPIPAVDIVPAGPVEAAPPLPPAAAGPCDACSAAQAAITLRALAERSGDAAARACAPAIRYSAMWATHLSDDLPLPPAARVIEAAGSDGARCRLRAVAYGAAMPVATLLAGEYARASRAGYAVTYQAAGDLHALTARRARDGSGLVLVARDAGDGIADVRVVMAGER